MTHDKRKDLCRLTYARFGPKSINHPCGVKGCQKIATHFYPSDSKTNHPLCSGHWDETDELMQKQIRQWAEQIVREGTVKNIEVDESLLSRLSDGEPLPPERQ
jgi:hypothetical protein